MQGPYVLYPQFGLWMLHTFTQMLQDFNIEFCINSLTCWNIFMMKNSINIKQIKSMIFFSNPGVETKMLPLFTLPLCFRITHKSRAYLLLLTFWETSNPGCSQSRHCNNQHFFVLFISQNFWNNFCTIFCMSKSSFKIATLPLLIASFSAIVVVIDCLPLPSHKHIKWFHWHVMLKSALLFIVISTLSSPWTSLPSHTQFCASWQTRLYHCQHL